MFQCQECGRKFRTSDAAERAVRRGCPKCGGSDIDLAFAPMSPAARTAAFGPQSEPQMTPDVQRLYANYVDGII